MKKKNSLPRRIVKFFDKHVVTPITRLVLRLSKVFDKSSHRFETFLSKQTTLLFLSLFLAIALFVVVDQKILVFNNRSAEMFKNQKVEVLYNEERFVLEGVPESVDITLMGSKADLYIARQSTGKNTVRLDLTDITEPGTYRRELQYNNGDLKSIEASVNPSEATIIVYLKESENRDLSYNVINTDHLDSTIEVESVSLNIDKVVISGAGKDLERVSTVEALIDVDKLISSDKNNTKLTAGKYTLDDITLVAYDAKGNIVDVEINHSTKPTAQIVLSSSSREIPLNFVLKENTKMPFGKAVESYTFSQDSVVVYGSQDVLDKLQTSGIDIEFDASMLTSNYHGTVEIPKPAGIKKLDTNRIDVNITVTNSVSSAKYNMTVRIDAVNVPSGFRAGLNSSTDSEVLIRPTCAENVCKALSNADIEAYVDLSGIKDPKEGVYELPVLIRARTSNARLSTFVVSPEKVKIKLSRQ